MSLARYVRRALIVVTTVLLLIAATDAATSTTTTTTTTTTTAAPNSAMRNLKKLLSNVDPLQVVDGVTRFVYCASHHYKSLVEAVSPHLKDWATCESKHPNDLDAHVACYIKSSDNLANLINLGQQIGNTVACLASSSVSDVICVKKVQKPEECANMCDTVHTPLTNETIVIVSPALPATVRKDDCKLSPRLLANNNASASTNLSATLDVTMKFMQCIPLHLGESYQHLVDHYKVVNNCTLSHDESWGAWAKCIVDNHDVKMLTTYLVKVRHAVACIVGGDLPAQTVCVRTVKNPEDCKTCGGPEAHHYENPPPLGPSNNCVA